MARMLVGLLLVAALAYVAVVALAFAFQRHLVYLPDYTRVEAGGTDFALDRGDAVLRGWVVNPGKPAAIIYFGGNAEAVQMNEKAEKTAKAKAERIVAEAREELAKDIASAKKTLEKDTLQLVKRAASLATAGVADAQLDAALIKKSLEGAKK